jgi:hypothetical protein
LSVVARYIFGKDLDAVFILAQLPIGLRPKHGWKDDGKKGEFEAQGKRYWVVLNAQLELFVAFDKNYLKLQFGAGIIQ